MTECHEAPTIDDRLHARLREALEEHSGISLSLFDPSLPDVRPGQLPVLQSNVDSCRCEVRIESIYPNGDLVTTVPHCWQVQSCMTIGRFIHGLVGHGDQRLMFTTHVLNVRSIGESSIGLIFAAPQFPREAQRREFCRVRVLDAAMPLTRVWRLSNLYGCTDIEAQVTAAGRSRQDGEQRILPIPECAKAPPLEGVIIDISAGGVGIGLKSDIAKTLSRDGHYWIEFRLPGSYTPLPVVACFVHHRPRTETSSQVGFQFKFSHNPRYRTFFVDEVCRFVAQIQREQLRRSQGRDPLDREIG